MSIMGNIMLFLVQWGLTSLSLWVASYIFSGLRFADGGSLLIAALVLGFANAVVKPLLILFTLPLTVLTMGLFLLVVNALVLMLVSALVSGFTISSFWTALFASIFISLFSLFVSGLVF
jgi:putative membrane protein